MGFDYTEIDYTLPVEPEKKKPGSSDDDGQNQAEYTYVSWLPDDDEGDGTDELWHKRDDDGLEL